MCIARIAEAGDNTSSQFNIGVWDITIDKCQWSGMTGNCEVRELRPVSAQIIGFAGIPGNDQLSVVSRAKMTPDLEQHDVVKIIISVRMMVPEILELSRIGLIGQETASARRLRVFGNAKLVR